MLVGNLSRVWKRHRYWLKITVLGCCCCCFPEPWDMLEAARQFYVAINTNINILLIPVPFFLEGIKKTNIEEYLVITIEKSSTRLLG